MPVKKTGRKRQYRRRQYKKPQKPLRYQVADMAYSAYKGVKYLKDLVNLETKFYDTSFAATINNTGTMTLLSAIPQGNQESQRVGDSVKLQTLQANFMFSMNNATAYTNVRIIIFKGDRENTSTPTGAWLLNGGSLYDLKTWRDRFQTRILYDNILTFSNTGTLAKVVRINQPLNFHCNFAPTSTTVEDGGLWMYVISDIAATNFPSITGSARVLYTDD